MPPKRTNTPKKIRSATRSEGGLPTHIVPSSLVLSSTLRTRSLSPIPIPPQKKARGHVHNDAGNKMRTLPTQHQTPVAAVAGDFSVRFAETNGSERISWDYRATGNTTLVAAVDGGVQLSRVHDTHHVGHTASVNTTADVAQNASHTRRSLSSRLRGKVSAASKVLISPFMPEGYPHSVSSDYADYQFWDTLQCLCSSVTGALSTRSVLMGVGVGQAEATVLSGTISWLMRDVWSKIGAVWFAAYYATDLDNDAKRWRFVADLANDTALFLEIFSYSLPQAYFMLCVCVASLFRAICGVSGGSSRASLTQHFSLRHNMADVAAKDGSQETLASLIGMFLGMFVAWLIPETNLYGTLLGFIFFTGMHLYTNYRAVTSLVLTHFNRHRARHCIVQFLKDSAKKDGDAVRVLGTIEANKREGVLLMGASSREPFTLVCGAKASDILLKHRGADVSAAVADAVSHIFKAARAVTTPIANSTALPHSSYHHPLPLTAARASFAVIANASTRHYDVLLGPTLLPSTTTSTAAAGFDGAVDAPASSDLSTSCADPSSNEAILWAYYCICKDYYGGDGAGRKHHRTSPAKRTSSSSSPIYLILPRDDDGYLTFRQKALAAGWDLSKLQFRVTEWRVALPTDPIAAGKEKETKKKRK